MLIVGDEDDFIATKRWQSLSTLSQKGVFGFVANFWPG